MTHRLVETAPPESEPLSLEEAKSFLRVDHDSDDDLIAALIAAARQLCEETTGRSLITRSYSLFADNWPEGSSSLPLPRPPLAGVTAVYTHMDDNAPQEYADTDYYVDTTGAPGRLVLRRGAVPPQGDRIQVQYTAGYGDDAEDVPAVLRQGLLRLVAHMYAHRGDAPSIALRESGAGALFHPYRIVSLA